MEVKLYQYPRGANKGGILKGDICPTISTSSWENNCLLIECNMDDLNQNHNNKKINHLKIMEPKIIKEGNYSPSNHNASSIVNVEGIAPTVMENHGTITAIKEQSKNIDPICLNSKVDGKQPSLQDRVYDIEGIATACTTSFHPNVLIRQDGLGATGMLCDSQVTKQGYAVTNGHKDGAPKIIEPIACAMRGRKLDNPSERARSNGKYQQRIEMGSNISNTITTVQKDSLVADPLRIPQATKQGYAEVEEGGVFDAAYPESKTRRGRVQENGTISPTLCTSNELCVFEGIEQIGYVNDGKHQQDYVQGTNGVSRAVCAGSHASTPHLLKTQLPNYRIRKLTPRECFRLMGVSEEDIDTIQAAGISNSQQYKLAGNSIVVDVLYYIFKNLLCTTSDHTNQTLFSAQDNH